MTKSAERDKILTKQIAQMAAELQKAQITDTETAQTNLEESLTEERLHTLPSKAGGGDGRGPLRPPNIGEAPNPGVMGVVILLLWR